MKWRPGVGRRGAIIRIQVGSIYHYGIFVDEAEVIQFGPAPVGGFLPAAQLRVEAVDIDTFACGRIVEIETPNGRERRRRFSAEKTVERARSRIGEGGYNLLHNNCEHFVYDCAYGEKRCTQEQEARRQWYSRPILDVYVFRASESEMTEAREALVSYAVEKSLGQSCSGGRPPHGAHVSLANNGRYGCIAVSNGAAGLAVGKAEADPDTLRTESRRQRYGRRFFLSYLGIPLSNKVILSRLPAAPDCRIAVYGEKVQNLRFFYSDTVTPFRFILTQSEKSSC